MTRISRGVQNFQARTRELKQDAQSESRNVTKPEVARALFEMVKDEKLSEAEIKSISKELEALMEMECVFKPADSLADEIMGALTAKFTVAERQRPDPIQMWTAFINRALSEQRPAEAAIVDYIQELADATFG